MDGRQLTPIPEKCEVIANMDTEIIRWKWFSLMLIPLICFCVAWNSLLIFWYSAALTSHGSWLMIVFPVAHVAVGVGLSYYVIAGLFNRTDVIASPAGFRVRHYPVPWPGNVTVDRMQVRQLYVRRGAAGRTQNYELCMIGVDNRSKTVIAGIESEERALFLEKKIEDKLRIKDEPVAGEVRIRESGPYNA